MRGFLGCLLISGCTHLFYYPDSEEHYPPAKMALNFVDVFFDSADGTTLHGWFFPAHVKNAAEDPKGTIIQFHGNAQNISSHYLSLVWLVDRGYNLFTFDYRGYGKSKGRVDQKGLNSDALAAFRIFEQFHEKTHAKMKIVYAQSLGGAVALRAAEEMPDLDTDLFVIDSSFLSYKDVAQQKLASFWLTWLFSPLGRVLVSDAFSAEESIRKLKSKMLVIHDTKDPVVPYKNGLAIFEAAPEPKEFWDFEAGSHVGFFFISVENRKRFDEYLDSLALK